MLLDLVDICLETVIGAFIQGPLIFLCEVE